jgi:two-component system, OmpR family, phosphate regulon sensor histidine kinase PhoR
MKPHRTYLFIAISSVALMIVLIIQVNWIYQTAQIKETIFNEKATIILTKTTEVLSMDKETCRNLEFCVSPVEIRKVDSLFNHYMKEYNVHIDYYYEFIPVADTKSPVATVSKNYGDPARSYATCLPAMPPSRSGMALKLAFPDRGQFIMAEMGTPFITSVILILVVLVMSARTILSLTREKIISEHTTEFLNNMTHEFKTPLTNIALAGKMMVKESNIGQPDKVRHYSGIILGENEKLRQQVEQVLSMTALERGEIPLMKSELDLHALIVESLKCITVQIENRQGKVSLELDAERTIVNGDKTHLMNAVCNLVDNSIKYSVDKPEIIIRTSNLHDNILVTVSDNGMGIDDRYHDKVFEKFFRVPKGDVHDVKGFGLGLAYVKKIIEMHGGTIELRSDIGAGTSIHISLPNV